MNLERNLKSATPKEMHDYVPRLVVSLPFPLAEALARLPLPLPGEIVTANVVEMRAHLDPV